MVSEEEYHEAKWQLENFPTTITGQARSRKRQQLKHIIKEYEYSIKYPPFTPAPYLIYHVNRTISDAILTQIITAANTTTFFCFDTESVIVHYQPNKPTLIQIEAILPRNYSIVIIIECCYLPSRDTFSFSLIKKLMTTIFNSNNTIYVWGEADELLPFKSYNLFDDKQ
ncbi:unnamed protein product [Adineta steineri]|uniref:Uncharacterized protein n=1 Tax=Adineta steineri TaxID=433720 RepID=A0A814B4L4_9BILA|nr:unnamed protein product [Adineta steineri]